MTGTTAGFILPDMGDLPDKSASRNEAGAPQTIGDILASALKLEDQISSGAYEDYMKPENWPERLDEGIFLLIRKHLTTLVTDTRRHRETLLALVQEYGQDG